MLQTFRESGGKKKVWGKAPRKITARYETGDGQTKTSLLLTSGAPLTCNSTQDASSWQGLLAVTGLALAQGL